MQLPFIFSFYRESVVVKWSMPDSKGHLEYHTEGYESWVLKKMRSKSGEIAIRLELDLIGKMLQENNIPKEAQKK
jgi:hypothetical protein